MTILEVSSTGVCLEVVSMGMSTVGIEASPNALRARNRAVSGRVMPCCMIRSGGRFSKP